MLHAWEQWDAAHEAYGRVQALAPRTFDWPYLDAVVLQRLALPSDAVAKLREALKISADYLPGASQARGGAPRCRRSRTERTAVLGAERPSLRAAVQFGLGRIAAAQGRHAEAIQGFERAIALFPEFGSAHYALALSYRATGKRDEAQAELRRHAEFGARWPALGIRSSRPLMHSGRILAALIKRGTRLADAGDLEGAIAAHEAALARDPSLAQAHENLISLYGRTKNWTKGEEHYDAVARLGGMTADASYDYAVLLSMQEKWEPATEAYRKAIALNPQHARAHNNLGQILERQRQLDAASAEYRLAVDSQPTLRIARFNLGRMLVAQSKFDDAISELQKLSEPRDGETPRYLFALAAAHVRAGHRDEGRKLAEEARQLALAFGQTELAASIERDLGDDKMSGAGSARAARPGLKARPHNPIREQSTELTRTCLSAPRCSPAPSSLQFPSPMNLSSSTMQPPLA